MTRIKPQEFFCSICGATSTRTYDGAHVDWTPKVMDRCAGCGSMFCTEHFKVVSGKDVCGRCEDIVRAVTGR